MADHLRGAGTDCMCCIQGSRFLQIVCSKIDDFCHWTRMNLCAFCQELFLLPDFLVVSLTFVFKFMIPLKSDNHVNLLTWQHLNCRISTDGVVELFDLFLTNNKYISLWLFSEKWNQGYTLAHRKRSFASGERERSELRKMYAGQIDRIHSLWMKKANPSKPCDGFS